MKSGFRPFIEEWLPAFHRQPADVHRVKSIDILMQRDGIKHCLFIELIGEGKLDKYTMHFGIRS
jgi:hypothetical protein